MSLEVIKLRVWCLLIKKLERNLKIADHDFRFLCESILGEDMKVKLRKYFIRFEVLKALKQL